LLKCQVRNAFLLLGKPKLAPSVRPLPLFEPGVAAEIGQKSTPVGETKHGIVEKAPALEPDKFGLESELCNLFAIFDYR
jgi:hypothetical protein